MAERGYDQLVVWADREHSANLAYLTGFDPRFEEAVLIVGTTATRPSSSATSAGHGRAAPLPMRRHLFQDLSLPSQPRDRPPSLPRSCATRASAGQPGRRRRLEDLRRPRHDRRPGVPRRRAPALAAPPAAVVENATDLLIDPADGLRVINEVEQLAAFEWAACQTSDGVRRSSPAAAGHDRAGGGAACWRGTACRCRAT